MREPIRDPQRLLHIIEAIDKLTSPDSLNLLVNINEKDINYFGIIKLLEIIGEAAYKLTKEFKESHPQTPWIHIINMRHILVHGYYIINKEDVVKTIKEDLPELNNQIKEYLKEFD